MNIANKRQEKSTEPTTSDDKQNNENSGSIILRVEQKATIDSLLEYEYMTIQCNLFSLGSINVGNWIGSLTKLKCLIIKQSIQYLPNEMGNLTNLIKLSVNGNCLRNLPATLGALTNLNILCLAHNYFGKWFPFPLYECISLEALNLAENQIMFIHRDISRLENLVELNLSNNELSSLPQNFFELTNLVQLNVKQNNIHNISSSIGALTKLMFLDISRNKISEELPETITKLTNITELNAGYNELTKIPKNIGSMIKLMVLSFRFNSIQVIQPSISSLANIKFLDLSHNQNSCISNLCSLTTLRQLNLESNKIDKIPVQFSELTKLDSLSLSENNLKVLISNSFGTLRNINNLCLDNNNIQYISDDLFFKFPTLTYLALGRNKLSYIPNSIRNHSSIKTLKISDNELEDPLYLPHFHHLSTIFSGGSISAKGNPFKNQDITKTEELRIYCRFPSLKDITARLVDIHMNTYDVLL